MPSVRSANVAATWGSQLASALTNFLGQLAAAFVLDDASFALFSVLAVTVVLGLNVVRAVAGEHVLLGHAAVSSVLGSATLTGGAIGVVAIGIGILSASSAWIWLGGMFPFLAALDGARYVGFARQPSHALLLDVVWLVLLGVAVVVWTAWPGLSEPTATAGLLVWLGPGALVGAAVVARRIRRDVVRAGSTLMHARARASQIIAGDLLATPVFRLLLLSMLLAISGAEVVALFRRAELLYGPFTIVGMSAHVLLVRRAPQLRVHRLAAWSLALFLGPLVWAGLILAAGGDVLWRLLGFGGVLTTWQVLAAAVLTGTTLAVVPLAAWARPRLDGTPRLGLIRPLLWAGVTVTVLTAQIRFPGDGVIFQAALGALLGAALAVALAASGRQAA